MVLSREPASAEPDVWDEPASAALDGRVGRAGRNTGEGGRGETFGDLNYETLIKQDPLKMKLNPGQAPFYKLSVQISL